MARKVNFELSESGLKRVLKNASGRVVSENLNRGVAITVIERGQIVEVRPDKSRRVVRKTVPQPVHITERTLYLD